MEQERGSLATVGKKLLRSAMTRSWPEVDLLQILELPQCDQRENTGLSVNNQAELGVATSLNIYLSIKTRSDPPVKPNKGPTEGREQVWPLSQLMEHGAQSIFFYSHFKWERAIPFSTALTLIRFL